MIAAEPVFGSSLAEICKRERSTVPKFVRVCTQVIEERGLDADGLYRISGNLSAVQKIRCQVDQDKYAALITEADIHVVSGALKLFFRELHEPVFPWAMGKDFLEAIRKRFAHMCTYLRQATRSRRSNSRRSTTCCTACASSRRPITTHYDSCSPTCSGASRSLITTSTTESPTTPPPTACKSTICRSSSARHFSPVANSGLRRCQHRPRLQKQPNRPRLRTRRERRQAVRTSRTVRRQRPIQIWLTT